MKRHTEVGCEAKEEEDKRKAEQTGREEEEGSLALKPFLDGAVRGWEKTPTVTDAICRRFGLTMTEIHSLDMLREEAKYEEGIHSYNTHIIVSSSPSSGLWTFTTISSKRGFWPFCIAVGNGFYLVAVSTYCERQNL